MPETSVAEQNACVYIIEKRGDKWCLLTSDGSRVLGCHDTKEEALAQERAVQANKHELLTLPNREIFRAGVWNGDRYTIEDLDAMVEAYRETGYQPPLKPGHTDEPGTQALGAVANLRRVGDKLIGDFVDLTKEVYDAIRQRKWRHVSAEIFWNLKRGGKVFRRFLGSVALLGAEMPAVDGLKPVYAEVFSMPYDSVRRYTVPVGGEIRLTLEQVSKLCKPCAQKMRQAGLRELIIREEAGTYKMPERLREGLCNAIGGDPGFFENCVDLVSGNVDNAEAFCAWLHEKCLGELPQEAHRRETVMENPRTYRVEQRGEEWCLIGENDQPVACYPTKEEAEAALAKAVAPAAQSEAQAARLRELEEQVRQYQQQAEEARRLAAQLQEERRRDRVAAKAAQLIVPAWRPYVEALYDLATAAPKSVRFSVAQKAQDRPAEEVLDEFIAALNDAAKKLFVEVSVDPQERKEAPAEDPGTELDRRVRRYCEEHQLDYHRLDDYQKAMHAVLEADPELARQYARV